MVTPALLAFAAAIQLQGLEARPLGASPIPFQELVAEDEATLVVFATVWCGVCISELPALSAWSRAHPEVPVLYVLSGTEAARTNDHCDKYNLDFPTVLVDADGEVADRFHVHGTPSIFLLDDEDFGPFTRVEQVPEPKRKTTPKLEHFSDKGVELGTSYYVVLAAPPHRAEAVAKDLATVRSMTKTMEARLSEWQESSEISKLNRNAARNPVHLSDTLAAIIDGALGVSSATGGAFDITWRPLGELWSEAETRGRMPSEAELEEALHRVGVEHVQRSQDVLSFDRDGVALGIAGVAKGWIIDSIFLELERRGYEHILVNIGGDIRVRGRLAGGGPRVVELADPFAPSSVAARLAVDDVALATSGNYFRTRTIAGRTIGHILDPRTGRPPAFEGSVTVVTRDAAMADALATGLFVMGTEAGLDFARRTPSVDVVFVTRVAIFSTLEGVRSTGRPVNP